VTWAAPADIVYGTVLGAAQLNATASVPGTFDYTPAAGTVLDAGSAQTLEVTFTPTDIANFNDAVAHAAISVIYDFGAGFLAPLDLDKPFKRGSTIPVKFRLTDASGLPVPNAHVILRVQYYSSSLPAGDAIDATPTGDADIGNVFQYDGSGQYHYNLATKSLSVGTWSLQAALNDGTVRSVFITIKDN
jgi:hypothetical protein